jgi:aminoglycoside phosphotransferase family enzyme
MPERAVSVAEKVAALREPATYPDGAQSVEVVETHMSWVFLTEQFVYKLKKPARYDGLDCSRLETRHFFCQEEVRLNRRLAPAVYIDIVALRQDGQGRLRLGGEGEIVDWLVWMRRLTAHLTLDRLIEAGGATPAHMRRVAEHLAAFYRRLARAVTDPIPFAARLRREIDTFERDLCDPAWALPADEVTTVCTWLRTTLSDCREMLDARVRAGRIVEGHGDLRPEHVWLGEPMAIIDCLEFSAELRTLDTADELTFLALECERLGAPQLGRALFDAYAEFTGDVPAPALVDFYQAFRACVRANIAIRHLREACYRDDPKWPRRAREYLALARQKVLSCRT